jgi:hypothetical protein
MTDGARSLELTHSSLASNVVTLVKQNSVNVSQHVVGMQPYSSNQLSTISTECTETPDEKRRRLRIVNLLLMIIQCPSVSCFSLVAFFLAVALTHGSISLFLGGDDRFF